MLNLVNDKIFSTQFNGFQQGFFLGEDRFYPVIHSEGNVQIVDLPNENKVRPKQGQYILWQISNLRELDTKLAASMNMLIASQSFSFGLGFDPPLPLLEWQKLLEYRDKLLASLRTSAADLPENLLLFLKFDLSFMDLQDLFFFLSRDAFFPFQIICKHPDLHRYPYAFDYIGWNFASCMGTMDCSKKIMSIPIPKGFLLPDEKRNLPLELIEREKMRIIPSSQLTELWEGMDELYLLENSLSLITKRKIAGFEAAGGTVHILKDLPNV